MADARIFQIFFNMKEKLMVTAEYATWLILEANGPLVSMY